MAFKIIITAEGVCVLSGKPTKVDGQDGVRVVDGQRVPLDKLAYFDSNDIVLATTGLNTSFTAEDAIYEADKKVWRFMKEDGTKASAYEGRGLQISVEEIEDEAPKAKKKAAAAEEDDDPPPKKKARAAEPDEDDDPPPRKSKRAEPDEDDDPPPRKSKKAAAEEEEEDDTPPRKSTKKKAAEEDDDDTPPPRKKKAAEEDDDDTPAPKKKKAAADDDFKWD